MITGPSWARRFGSQVRRLCARPGCGTPAAATLRFQPTQREAWLVDLDDAGARTEGDLCARHAASLVLPRGWQLHDQRSRTDAPQISASAAPPVRRPRSTGVARSRRRRSSVSRAETLPGLAPVDDIVLADEPVEPVELSAPAAAAPEPVAPPAEQPAPDPNEPHIALSEPAREELADALDAETPLLRRAFQNVWPFETE